MLNEASVYFECGAKAARARNHKDMGMFQFQNDWFNRAYKLEDGDENKRAARKAFNAGYDSECAFSMQSTL